MVPWDPFLMKKLIKNEICGSVNSARITIHWEKSTFAATIHHCSLNSSRIPPKTRGKKKKKNEKNENAASLKRRRSLSAIQTSTKLVSFEVSWTGISPSLLLGINYTIPFFINQIFFLTLYIVKNLWENCTPIP